MIGSNPLLAPILAASMTNSPSGLGAPTPPSGPTGLPGLLSNLPGMANPQGNDMGQQTQMLQAMSQLLMLNNPGTAPNPSLQSAALLQNQVSIDNPICLWWEILRSPNFLPSQILKWLTFGFIDASICTGKSTPST